MGNLIIFADMKKLILSFGFMFGAAAVFASSHYLTFRMTDGTECSFATTSLSMTVGSDGKLLVCNDVTKAELDLSLLASMRFTEEVSDIEETTASDDVTVFSLKGERLGDYKSVKTAEKLLPAGTYVFKFADKPEKRIIK